MEGEQFLYLCDIYLSHVEAASTLKLGFHADYIVCSTPF